MDIHEDHLRRAFQLAREAGQRGDGAFGALLVSADGDVVLEAGNSVRTDSDCTAHAETNLVREASRKFAAEALGAMTLYASCEPCPMCSGAIFWSGIGRVVFGLRAARYAAIMDDAASQMTLTCADVLAQSPRPIAVVGPCLEDEAADVFRQ